MGVLIVGAVLTFGACFQSTSTSDGGTDATTDVVASDVGSTDASTSFTEKPLTLELALGTVSLDAGADADSDGGATTVSTLTITARDESTPIVTDVWLYTLDGQGNKTPLTGFTSTQARKSPHLMLPALINGNPSGLSPADDGNANGVMTCACGSRGTLDQGAFISSVTGTVIVTLPSAPTTAILVIAAIEDERFAGAAAINPDGTTAQVPSGVGTPETHTYVSFVNDVAPILSTQCISCHTGQPPMSDAGSGVGPGYSANFYAVTGSADQLVNDNFSINEQTLACETKYPDGGLPLSQCIQGITQAQFLVEPGAPAASDLLQRSRPDENGGTSPSGVLWYGSKGSRYNTTYGDRRMPSTTLATSADSGTWNDQPCYFDTNPAQFQILWS